LHFCAATHTPAIWYCHSPRPHLAIWWLQGLRPTVCAGPKACATGALSGTKQPPMPAAASRATTDTDASRRDVTPSNIPDHVPISPPRTPPPTTVQIPGLPFFGVVSRSRLWRSGRSLRGECAAGEGRACLGVVSLATTSYGRRSPRPVTEHGAALFRRREVEEYSPLRPLWCVLRPPRVTLGGTVFAGHSPAPFQQ
jgi:hypothetical protein